MGDDVVRGYVGVRRVSVMIAFVCVRNEQDRLLLLYGTPCIFRHIASTVIEDFL